MKVYIGEIKWMLGWGVGVGVGVGGCKYSANKIYLGQMKQNVGEQNFLSTKKGIKIYKG